MNNKQIPEDSVEKMLEQGAGKQPMGAQTGKTITVNPIQGVTSLVDPNSWVRELYGIPEPKLHDDKSKPEQNKDNKNNTPLDMNKVGSKSATPDQQRFFKNYQEEYEQFLNDKTQKAQNQKRQEEEQEQKRKEQEEKKRQEEQQGGDQEAHGKQKQQLGQPRRKATTEQHPETKMGGAK